MPWIIGQKLDMTRITQENKVIPVTIVRVPVLKISQVKTQENDGYSAIVLDVMKNDSIVMKKEITINQDKETEYKKWGVVDMSALEGIEMVSITATSKGKGFAGAMKRWNFSGGPGRVGSKFHRALGSIGTRKPRRTKPGKKMHGHMGTDTVTLKKIPLVYVDNEKGYLALKGPIPGARNSYFLLQF